MRTPRLVFKALMPPIAFQLDQAPANWGQFRGNYKTWAEAVESRGYHVDVLVASIYLAMVSEL